MIELGSRRRAAFFNRGPRRHGGCNERNNAGSKRWNTKSPNQEVTMLSWSVAFFIVAIIAAIFGFGGIAASAASVAKLLFVIFLVLAVVSLALGRRVRA
ncbi:DUF1328 domain-containing protein [Sorangium sp. So ce429]